MDPDQDQESRVKSIANRCLGLMLAFVVLPAVSARASVVYYSLDNVIMQDNSQLTGTFSWTFDPEDFENGTGTFLVLSVPYSTHDQTDLDATIDVSQSIEITLGGVSVHDDGVDITLVLLQPLTPTTSSLIDLELSKYEIGGNGFFDGLFLSGGVSPIPPPLDGDANFDGTVNALDLSIVAANWLTAVGNGVPDGDFNSDGTVNALDLSMLATNWLSSSGGDVVAFQGALQAVNFNAIPEASSGFLIGAGAVLLTTRRRTRRAPRRVRRR